MSSAPTGTFTPSTSSSRAAIRCANSTPRLRSPIKDDPVDPLVLLGDLMGNPGDGPRDPGPVQHLRLLASLAHAASRHKKTPSPLRVRRLMCCVDLQDTTEDSFADLTEPA